MINPQSSWRERMAFLFQNSKIVIGIEILIVITFQLLHAFRVIPTAAIFLVLLGWFSLWLRKKTWRSVGLSRPVNWLSTIGIGISLAIIFQVISIWVIVPTLEKITNTPLDLRQFEVLRSNTSLFVVSIIASWTYAAFIEEMAYRGYLLNRFKDLLGVGQFGWILATIITSVLFGLSHTYQGISGVVDTFLAACMMAGVYFIGKRNLWLPIIVHGVKDTIGFTLIFLGLYP